MLLRAAMFAPKDTVSSLQERRMFGELMATGEAGRLLGLSAARCAGSSATTAFVCSGAGDVGGVRPSELERRLRGV
jgi:hypothetical protein